MRHFYLRNSSNLTLSLKNQNDDQLSRYERYYIFDLVKNKGKFREKWVFEDFWLSEKVSVSTEGLQSSSDKNTLESRPLICTDIVKLELFDKIF